MTHSYDLVVLGGGTGGYVAAIKAAQSGLKTAIVEKKKLGGTCLHSGCIPSKALLKSAELYALMKDSAQFGIEMKEMELHFPQVQRRKEEIVHRLYNGVKFLMKKNKIDIYEGHGRILGPSIFSPTAGTISVEMNDGSENVLLTPKNIIIATGSRPNSLPSIDSSHEQVITSEEALRFKELPRSVVIVGGGAIGTEWASLLSDFDVDVTLIESRSRLLSSEEKEISLELQRRLEKRGVKVFTNASFFVTEKKSSLHLTVDSNGTTTEIAPEKILLAIGRIGNIEHIGLENTDIEVKDGFIATNEYFQTKESHIYAIGDVVGGMQLAHVAAREGIVAVEHILNKKPWLFHDKSIPMCVYTRPEVARVGWTEEEAKVAGYSVQTSTFPLSANGKALIHGDGDGFVKVVVDRTNDDVLGVHMIGTHATELITEASLATYIDASRLELSEVIRPHPTVSEMIGEAALGVVGEAIHL